MATEVTLKSVGAFHFGVLDKSCPIRSLESELEKPEYGLENSLIVLPEGFNMPGGYYGGTGPTPSIKSKLLALSERYQIAFVAGLIEEHPANGYPKGFNSAYLIDAASVDQFTLLSQKRKDHWARTCSSNPNGCRKPVRYKGIGIAALICTDFIDCDEKDRAAMIEQSEWAGCSTKVLCVPAYSTHRSQLIGASARWEGQLHVVAANGTSEDDSFVSISGLPVTRLTPGEWNGIQGNDTFGYPHDRILMSSPLN